MAKAISYIIGIVALVLGIVGFFNDPILGTFKVGEIHNIIYLVVGVALIGSAAMGDTAAAMGAKIIGVVVAIVGLLGIFMISDGAIFGIVETNFASSILQLVVAAVLLVGGFLGGSGTDVMEKAKGSAQKAQGGMGRSQMGGTSMQGGGESVDNSMGGERAEPEEPRQ